MSNSVRYVMERKLSEGGMAEVFLARQGCLQGFEKRVVLKSVLPCHAGSEEFVNMLLNEARLAARLDHPNLVQVLDLTQLEGRHYIVMEYLQGENLRAIQKRAHDRKTRLSLGVACRIVADVLAGLAYAHAQVDDAGKPLGLVHRDVSPPNVLVTFNGSVKLIDFGIAKATLQLGADVTRAGQFKGKCAYMSPEQIRSRPLDGRTDVFAAGIVLWELVTGKRLYARKSDVESMVTIVRDAAPAPSTIVPELPPELDEILERALARPLTQRYASAAEMRQDLEALIQQQGWASNAMAIERELKALFEPTPAELYDDDPTSAMSPDELPKEEPALAATAALQALAPPEGELYDAPEVVIVEPEPVALGGEPRTVYDDYPLDTPSARPSRQRRRWPRIVAAALVCFALGGLGSAAVRYFDRVPALVASLTSHR